MTRPYTIKNAQHRDAAISSVIERSGGSDYFAIIPLCPTTPTIASVATTDANWTALATGLTGVVMWRISELNGNDFHYAFEAVPGDNFSVAFAWASENTSPTDIYVKRTGAGNITLKLEYWTK